MARKPDRPVAGEIVEEQIEITLAELCRVCNLSAEQVIELVEYGVVEPRGRRPASWRFAGVCIRQVRRAQRLQVDLGVNTAGVALILELLEERDELLRRMRRFED